MLKMFAWFESCGKLCWNEYQGWNEKDAQGMFLPFARPMSENINNKGPYLDLCCLCLMDDVFIFRSGLIDYGSQLAEHFKYSLIFASMRQTDRKHRS